MVSWWALRELRKKEYCHLEAIRLQPLPMVSPEKTQGVKTQDAGPSGWGVYQRNGFSEPRLLHLPIHRKVLNSLTWLTWLSLINSNFLMSWTTCPLPQNSYISELPPYLLGAVLSGSSSLRSSLFFSPGSFLFKMMGKRKVWVRLNMANGFHTEANCDQLVVAPWCSGVKWDSEAALSGLIRNSAVIDWFVISALDTFVIDLWCMPWAYLWMAGDVSPKCCDCYFLVSIPHCKMTAPSHTSHLYFWAREKTRKRK